MKKCKKKSWCVLLALAEEHLQSRAARGGLSNPVLICTAAVGPKPPADKGVRANPASLAPVAGLPKDSHAPLMSQHPTQ